MREDCFALNTKTKKPTCTALTKMECENCRFYKTKTQALEENVRCRERCGKMGIHYKSMFKDSDFKILGQKKT